MEREGEIWCTPNTRRNHDAAHVERLTNRCHFCVDVYVYECKLLWYGVKFVCATFECDS